MAAPASPTAEAEPWKFTDDRGRTVTLDPRPERVVAFVGAAAGLWDFGLRPVGTFGPLKKKDGSTDPQAGNVDPDAVESLGGELEDSDMTFNVERYAALRPDLLVTVMRVEDQLWFVPEESAAEIEQIAPTIGIRASKRPISEPLERLAELAEALGADLQAPAVTRCQGQVRRRQPAAGGRRRGQARPQGARRRRLLRHALRRQAERDSRPHLPLEAGTRPRRARWHSPFPSKA